MTRIEKVSREQLTFCARALNMNSEVFKYCINGSTAAWAGYVDDDLICLWGLMPPTLLSRRAYLWFQSTPAMHGHEFVLARQSRKVVSEMLSQFPEVFGHCISGMERSQRWIKWLGGEFGEPTKGLIPFVIRHG